MEQIYDRFQNLPTGRIVPDFDDRLKNTALLLCECPDVCAQLSDRFRYLLVDEYQDTNRARDKSAQSRASSHSNICVTGDPDQSIYRWRGADIRNILAFETDWPDAAVVKLEENFRSGANILKAADNLISFNRNRKQKKLIPTKPAGKTVKVNVFEDERDEANGIARQIKQLAVRSLACTF